MKKTIIGLLTGLALVGFISCKGEVESGGGSGSGGGSIPTGNFKQTGYIKTGTQNINGTNYDLVTFGNFPQSEKDSNVIVSTTATNVNGFICYKGDDDEWYVQLNSKYYKVEPIKWRVLTENYDHDGNASNPGKKLLLAENILINCMYYDYGNYAETNVRTIDTASVYMNNYEHSRVRAYLNGLSYQKKAGYSTTQKVDETFLNKGFFQTAFTKEEQDAIATTTVVNNARSTNPDSNDKEWNNGVNQYASDTPTSDKIFLLSLQEATKADYGFAAYKQCATGNTRIRMTTDFAKANGADQSSEAGYGGYWLLRSPLYLDSDAARYVDINGGAYPADLVDNDGNGVVPALCLK